MSLSLSRRLRRRRFERDWQRELATETNFWEGWLDTRGDQWPEDFAKRLDPDQPLEEPAILGLLRREPRPRLEILDVGAGPLTTLGKRHDATEISITAVDPLADEYDRMLDERGIDPPVQTQACRGEDLLSMFPERSFDVVHARNSLDHAVDPLAIIEAMVRLARPGGLVVLRHHPNEAASGDYEGLHQWNFEAAGGRLWLWNETERNDVVERLGGAATLRSLTGEEPDSPWVVAELAPRG